MAPAPASFGVELNRLLAAKHVTYRELALRTGLSAGALNHYGNGRRVPEDETIERIAVALEVEPADFYEWRRRRAHEYVDGDGALVEALWRRAAG